MLLARPPLRLLSFSTHKACSKSRKCSKSNSHVGKCDNNRQHNGFWEKSPFFRLKKAQGDLSSFIEEAETRRRDAHLAEQELSVKEKKLDSLVAVAEEKVAAASTYFVVYIV